MAQRTHELRPVMLKAQLESHAVTLQEERRRILEDVNGRIEQNELDRALVVLYLCRPINPFTMNKLRELGLADSTGLTMQGRARLVKLWDQYQPAQETMRNLLRPDGQG